MCCNHHTSCGKQQELYEWLCRARRDILAHEFLMTPVEEPGHGGQGPRTRPSTWDDLQTLLRADDRGDILPPDEPLSTTIWKIEELRGALEYPGDPGDPPLPPLL